MDAFPGDPQVIAFLERFVAASPHEVSRENAARYLGRVVTGQVMTGWEP